MFFKTPHHRDFDVNSEIEYDHVPPWELLNMTRIEWVLAGSIFEHQIREKYEELFLVPYEDALEEFERRERPKHIAAKQKTLLMGTHPRVGEASPLLMLYNSPKGKEAIKKIVEYVNTEPYRIRG